MIRKLEPATSVTVLSVGFLAFSVILTGIPAKAFAAAGEYDYPELLVTPRASDRIESEAAKEDSRKWTTQLPAQLSALTTLTAGILQLGNSSPEADPDSKSGIAGIAVGGGWLLVSTLMAMNHRPYSSAAKELAGMPRKTQREQLTRERFAEEEINSAARLGRKLSWLSFLTNAGASIYMVTKAESGTIAPVADAVAIGMALAPLVFRYHWQDVAKEQSEYKKKIYAPVASAAIFNEPQTGKAAPGMTLSFFF